MAFIKNINTSPLSDEQLIIAYKQSGNLDRLGELYDRYIELSYGVCLKYLSGREAAQDAVLQVFEELIEKLKKHDPQNFKRWLYTVVKNHCLMQLRKSQPRIVSFDTEIMQSAEELHQEDRFNNEIRMNSLSACIETLSAEQKTSVELFYFKEKCYKEIAELTGLELNKVRSLIQNGKRNLKICMEKKSIKKFQDEQ